METAISVRNLTKTYASGEAAVHAVSGVDLDAHGGQVVMLMGPSGSGKTTLLSIMGCILRATSGSVRIHGREVSGLKERELPRIRLAHLGFIFQGFNLFPALTAGENVEYVGLLKGLHRREARQRAHALFEQVGLADKYNMSPADLSGGQKQRVAIARALAGDPDIILADEPTAALDSHSGHHVMEMLVTLAHKRGRAVVIVTHDNRILEFADRIIKIEDGKILDD
ncbi:MAG TPA: ABC transporter ATP-binding protein [Terriglobia bacterium]|nr:ABC transporter ATP-binding protein [Terriglobia bacterium]